MFSYFDICTIALIPKEPDTRFNGTNISAPFWFNFGRVFKEINFEEICRLPIILNVSFIYILINETLSFLACQSVYSEVEGIIF